MSKRKVLLKLIFLLCLGQAVLADDKYKAPVPQPSDQYPKINIKVGKIAILPYADIITVYPTTGDLVKGKENYFFTSAVEGQYLFTLIMKEGINVTGELLTLTVNNNGVISSTLTKAASNNGPGESQEVVDWWAQYATRIVKEKLRSDVIGKETTDAAKTWPNDWKKWYNKMVPVIKQEAKTIPLVTHTDWAQAYTEIWKGLQ